MGSAGGQTTGSPVLLELPVSLVLVLPVSPVLVSAVVLVLEVSGPVVVVVPVLVSVEEEVLVEEEVVRGSLVEVVEVSPVLVGVVALEVLVLLMLEKSPLLVSGEPPQAGRARARARARRRGQAIMRARYAAAIGLPRIWRGCRWDARARRARVYHGRVGDTAGRGLLAGAQRAAAVGSAGDAELVHVGQVLHRAAGVV